MLFLLFKHSLPRHGHNCIYRVFAASVTPRKSVLASTRQFTWWQRQPVVVTSFRSCQSEWLYHYSTGGSSSPKATAEVPHPSILKRLAGIEDSVRFHGYSLLRIGISTVVVTGLGLYIFRDSLRDNVAEEVSAVASKSMADDQVRQTAQELSVNLLQDLLTDHRAQQQTVDFLEDLCRQPASQAAVIDLLTYVISQPQTQEQLTQLLKNIISQALADETFRQDLASKLHSLLLDSSIRHALRDLFKEFLEDQENQLAAQKFLRDVIGSPMVVNQATNLSKSVAEGVVKDPEMQRNTGDAMWSAFTYIMTPHWFRSGDPKSNENSNEGNSDVAQDALEEKVES